MSQHLSDAARPGGNAPTTGRGGSQAGPRSESPSAESSLIICRSSGPETPGTAGRSSSGSYPAVAYEPFVALAEVLEPSRKREIEDYESSGQNSAKRVPGVQ